MRVHEKPCCTDHMTSLNCPVSVASDKPQANAEGLTPVCRCLNAPLNACSCCGAAYKQRSGRGVLAVVLASVMLTACGGSSSSAPVVGEESTDDDSSAPLTPDGLDQNDTPDAGVVGEVGGLSEPTVSVPDDLAAIDRVALTIDASARCSTVGESFDVQITRALTAAEEAAGVLTEPQDVSAYVTLTQSLGNSLELLSRSDGAAQFRHRQQDVVGLTAELDNGSVTAYLSGFAGDAPESVILRKPVPGGCMYALRLPDYCATGIAKGGRLTFSHNDEGISAAGCELSNPANHPVIELSAPAG